MIAEGWVHLSGPFDTQGECLATCNNSIATMPCPCSGPSHAGFHCTECPSSWIISNSGFPEIDNLILTWNGSVWDGIPIMVCNASPRPQNIIDVYLECIIDIDMMPKWRLVIVYDDGFATGGVPFYKNDTTWDCLGTNTLSTLSGPVTIPGSSCTFQNITVTAV